MDNFHPDMVNLCKEAFWILSMLYVPRKIQDAFWEYVVSNYISFNDLNTGGRTVWEDAIRFLYPGSNSANSKQVELKSVDWQDHWALNEHYREAFLLLQQLRDGDISVDMFKWSLEELLKENGISLRFPSSFAE
jgi:hypothetical protein